MASATPSSPPYPRTTVRKRWAMAIDLAIAPLSLIGLSYMSAGVASLAPSWLGSEGRYILAGFLPGAVWLVMAGLCAWRGQTLGHMALGLRWIDDAGRPGRWRPLREPSFWCMALAGLLFVGCSVDLLANTLAMWMLWRVGHVVLGVPGAGVDLTIAVAMVTAIMTLAHAARRGPAYLARS